MTQERLPKHVLLAKANGGRPFKQPRARWANYIRDLGWNRLGIHPSKMKDVIKDREVWWLNLELLPRNHHGKAGNKERRRTLDRRPSFSLRFTRSTNMSN